MPYTTNPNPPSYAPAHHVLPQHLAHKPVYGLPYEAFDGPYATAGSTDVQFLTTGIAQWDACDVSIKTMRHTGDKWSRQAEELPPHRVIDMAMMVAKVVFDQGPHGAVVIPPQTLQGQASEITLTPETRTVAERRSYDAAIAALTPVLRERFHALRDVLNDLTTRGQL